MNTLHTLYIGSADRIGESCIATLSEAFPDGLTVLPARGVWRGGAEDSIAVQILGPESLAETLRGLARSLAAEHAEECILYVQTPAIVEFLAPVA